MLDLSYNGIRKIRHLEQQTQLTQLFLANNKITKMNNLTTFPMLTQLELGANRIRVRVGIGYVA